MNEERCSFIFYYSLPTEAYQNALASLLESSHIIHLYTESRLYTTSECCLLCHIIDGINLCPLCPMQLSDIRGERH